MKKNMFGAILTVLVMVGFLAGPAGIGTPAEAQAKQVIKLKIGSGHPPAAKWIYFLSTFWCKEVVKQVNEKTNYKLELSEHWGGSVAKLGEVLESTEIGVIDIGADIIVFEPTKLYLHNWPYFLPFCSPDQAAIARITAKLMKQFPVMTDILTKYNLKLLSASSAGDSYEMNTNFPLRKAADMKGHKVAGAGANLPWITGVGAVPVQGNLNEAYTSLQTGVYEGWIMTATGITSFKLHEISKYYTELSFGATSQLFTYMNLKNWNKLPKEVQKIIQETMDEFTFKNCDFIAQERQKSLKIMKDAGVDMSVLPMEEKIKWANQTEDLAVKYAREGDAKGWPATQIIKAAIKYNEEEGVKFPRKWMAGK